MAMGVFSSVFITAFALALTACATEKNLYLNFVDKKCVAETAKKQISVDWKQAKVLNFTIRDGVFDPDETYLKVNQPTILRFDNNDNTSRYFIDGEFFDSVALAQVSVGDATYDRPCITGVVISASNKTELRLVPLTEGIYYPEASPLWLLGLPQDKLRFIHVGS